jgi:hypothetical protein
LRPHAVDSTHARPPHGLKKRSELQVSRPSQIAGHGVLVGAVVADVSCREKCVVAKEEEEEGDEDEERREISAALEWMEGE